MLHQLIRYRPVIRRLKAESSGSVLEVGSGCYGITKFLDIKVYGVDINFHDYTGSRQTCGPHLSPTMASAEALPFKDSEFDLVFSCDMLEHIPAGQRQAVISEMVRVSRKKVILVFPCGKAAIAGDRLLNALCLKLGRKPPGWLTEHLALDFPSRKEVDFWLHGIGPKAKAGGNAGILVHYLVLLLESNRRLKNILADISTGRADGPRNIFLKVFLAIADCGPTYRRFIEINKHAA